jgi:hypothetical protein
MVRDISFVVCLALSAVSHAEPPTGSLAAPPPSNGSEPSFRAFGDKGTLSISNEVSGSLSYINVGGTQGVSLNLAPGADWFLARHLSIGGDVSLALSGFGTGTLAGAYSLTPRVGYLFSLTRSASLWPRLGLQMTAGNASLEGTLTGSAQPTFAMVLDAPLLFHLSDHFYVGVAPTLNVQFVAYQKISTLSLNLVLGGWR